MARRTKISRATVVRKKPSLDFSLTGLIYTSMMLFMGLAAINSQANLLFAVFGLMIGVLLVSGVISRIVLRKLEIRRLLPDHLTVDVPATLQYEFENLKRFWPTFSVTLGEINAAEAFAKQPQAYLLHAAARTKATIATQVLPRRRGLHTLNHFQISTSFPFGFIKRAHDRRLKDTLLVYPPIARVDSRLLQMFLSAEDSAARMRPRRGGNDEFYGVKEYRKGENPRFINWKRSARTGVLVSKEMTQIAPPRVYILIDTHYPAGMPAAEAPAQVERTIAMAASLTTRALEMGLSVGVHGWSGQWVTIAPSRGKQHERELMALISRLPHNPGGSRDELAEEARHFLRPGTTAVLLTPEASEQSLAESARATWVTITSGSEQAKRFFQFPPGTDFSNTMPLESGESPQPAKTPEARSRPRPRNVVA